MNRTVKGSVLAVALVLWPFVPVSAQPVFSPSQDPLAGSRVFGTKGCATCHAVNGIGGKVGPDLGRIARPRSFYDLATAMWNHLPRMVERMQQRSIPRPHLDPREVGDLIAFLYTLNYFDAPGNPEAGRRYFSEKRCIVCHQVGDTGGVVGPNLDFLRQFGTPIFVAAAVWNHGPQMTEAMKAGGIERPAFIGPELQDLIAYLAPASVGREGPVYVLPGRADTGRKLFAEKRCGSCHSVGGGGAGVGPDLVGRGVRRSLVEFAAAMWNKAPTMVAAMKAQGISLPQLRPEEMADIVAYLYSVRYFADPGNSRTGLALATEKGCLALWNHPVVKPVGTAGQKGAWPEFRPEEMADLVALLQSFGWTR
ncbi:MAG: c-type cytochrome [Candidatus Rokubacteria bacterium]|nr:c-type cytochrome [Candidatus Rokubacteria bacterium]